MFRVGVNLKLLAGLIVYVSITSVRMMPSSARNLRTTEA